MIIRADKELIDIVHSRRQGVKVIIIKKVKEVYHREQQMRLGAM